MLAMRSLAAGLSILMLFTAAGCGSGSAGPANRKKTVPVSGVVTFNNAPLEGATVTFSPGTGASGNAAFGVTDETGAYKLTTYELNDGAVPGSYQVTIAKQAAAERTPDPVNEEDYRPPEETEATPAKVIPLLPPKYASPASSGLTADVKDASGQTFDFKLGL
jgi:hypothetical protein